jgi:hypothetical protein
MAGRSDIEAGKAHIRLYVKNSELVKGLNWLGGKMQGLGTTVMKTGGMIAGLGASIVAPFVAAVSHFMAVGGALADMSARTGIAVGALAELGFAASQTGSGIEDVEKGVAKMQRTIAEAAAGEKTAADALTMLGLTAADLADKLPDEQLALVGERLTAIEDPAKRTAATMEVLGKSGTKLLPMLANLKELRAEAQRLGLAPTEKAVEDADALGDAWDAMQDVIKATVFEIGSALAPALIPIAESAKNIASSINRWVRENGGLIRTVAAVGAGLVAAGTAITVIGATIFGLGLAFSFAATAVAAIGAALASPLTLVIALGAALVAGVGYWARFTESGRKSVAAIISFFAPMVEALRTGIKAIGDALSAGDLVLAGRIAVKTLQLVFQLGLAQIAEAIGGTLGDVIGTVGTDLIAGDLAGVWQTVVAGMATQWADFCEGIVAMFTLAARGVTDLWEKTVGTISDSMLDSAGKGGFLGKLVMLGTGVDLEAEQARANKFNAALGLAPENVTDQAKAAARDQTAGTANAIRGTLDRLDQSMQAQSDAARDAFRDRVGGGAKAAGDEAARLQAELDALAAEARAAKEAAKTRTPEDAELAGEPSAAAVKQASFVTFSAAGLVAAGGGGNPLKRLIAVGTRTAVAVEGMARDVVTLKDKPVPVLGT